MEYVRLNGQFPKLTRSAVTLGKFDGIHRGHRKLIRTILERKKEYGELAVVMAFVSDRADDLYIRRTADISRKRWESMFFWSVR